MKTLTIKQPWASLIAHGIKDIENRSWRTHFRGRIYIHAGAAKKFSIQLTDPQMIQAMPLIAKLINEEVPAASIIGEVDIVDCVLNHPSIWAEHMITYPCEEIPGMHIIQKGQPYVWNWVLANPVLYELPILNVKGALSFWDYDKLSHGI